MTKSFRIGLTAVSLVALIAGGAQAQTRTLTMPDDLCLVDPLPRSAIQQIRARGDFAALLAYAARQCPEVALLLTETPTATIASPYDAFSANDGSDSDSDIGGLIDDGGDDGDDGSDDDGDEDHDHGDDHAGGHGGGGHGGGQGGGGHGGQHGQGQGGQGGGGGGHGGGGGGQGGGGHDGGDDHDHEQPA